jgi:endonuclease/exonuclease/phosphatase family metal-dependent hydrolase
LIGALLLLGLLTSVPGFGVRWQAQRDTALDRFGIRNQQPEVRNPKRCRAALATALHNAKKTLRVMTYNIHVGVGMDKRLDLQRIADVIMKEKPDLVGLQEVDRGVKRTEGKDEIAELARLTRMDYAFAHNLDYQGGQYGVAILSRTLIQKVDHRKFENLREAERRGMLRVEVEFDGRVISFVTTHLDYQHDDGRVFETEQLLKFLSDVQGPLVVVGDFNDELSGNALKLMTARFADAWGSSRAKSEGLTYPADKPLKRIDYVFLRKGDGLHAKKSWVVNSLASDHLPLVVDVEIKATGARASRPLVPRLQSEH